MNRRAFLVATGAGVVGIAGCLDGEFSDDVYDIGMSQNAFLPEEYEASLGETVVWGNNGSRSHTVTAYEGPNPDEADYFASGGYEDLETAREEWRRDGGGNIYPGEIYEHTFEVTGRHQYFCIPHEAAGMVGTIIVTE